jgi:mono/diheme cytochrome c family protein
MIFDNIVAIWSIGAQCHGDASHGPVSGSQAATTGRDEYKRFSVTHFRRDRIDDFGQGLDDEGYYGLS